MRKFLVYALVLLVGVAIFTIFNNWENKTSSASVIPQEIKKIDHQPTKEPIAEPAKLVIEKIDVEADIESVGMDQQGRMDVPKNVHNAAWYNLGYKPGDMGGAVLSGHYDQQSGAPAVFYRLSELEIGDQISILDANGKKLVFEVSNKKTFPYDQLPLTEIFATAGFQGLNLITCAGSWNAQTKNYSTRTVIYSKLKK